MGGEGSVTMRIIHTMLAVAALAASACVCAAQDGSQGGKSETFEQRLTQMLLAGILEGLGPDSQVVVAGGRVVVTGGATFERDGRTMPTHELICDGKSVWVRDRQLAVQELYPAPEGFCETLVQALRRRAEEQP
jgi:hypothetical protein